MQRYRKRPHEVSAFQWKGWGQTPDVPEDIIIREHNLHTAVWLGRIQAWVRINLGDWVIEDIYRQGFYDVCARWQFEEDYDPIEAPPSTPHGSPPGRREGLI